MNEQHEFRWLWTVTDPFNVYEYDCWWSSRCFGALCNVSNGFYQGKIFSFIFGKKNCYFLEIEFLYFQTRMQSLLPTTSNQTLVSTLKYMIKSEGISRYEIWIIIFIIIIIHFKVRKSPLMNRNGGSAISDSNHLNIRSTQKNTIEANCFGTIRGPKGVVLFFKNFKLWT